MEFLHGRPFAPRELDTIRQQAAALAGAAR
jgi:hypothetical protein